MKKLLSATFACLLLMSAGAHARAGAAWAEFRNRVFSYSVSYPTTWLPIKSQGMDLMMRAADKNAGFGVVALVHQRRMSSAAVRAIAESEIYALGGSRKSAIDEATIVVHGVSFMDATAKASTPDGRVGVVEALVAYRAQTEYIFSTYIFTKVHGVASADASSEASALSRIKASFAITIPAGSVTPP